MVDLAILLTWDELCLSTHGPLFAGISILQQERYTCTASIECANFAEAFPSAPLSAAYILRQVDETMLGDELWTMIDIFG